LGWRSIPAAGDLDVLGWRERKLFAGEVKMTAGGFASQDIERDVAKSVAIGADLYIAACLEEIPDDVRGRMAAACEAAHLEFRCLDGPVLLLNSKEKREPKAVKAAGP
jgi:hypothetical protein